MLFSKVISKVGTVMLSLFMLQACSLTDKTAEDQATDESSDIKSIGQELIDMGSIPKATQKDGSVALQKLSQRLPVDDTQYQQFLAQQALIKNELSSATKAHYQSALTQMKNKNWQSATVLLDDVIAQDPQLSGAHLNKALAQYHLKQFDLATLSLKAAAKVNEINPHIYNLQGVLAREQGRFIAAETYYQKALTIWPDYPEAHLNLAVLFELYRGKFVNAKAHYQAYLRLKPDDKRTKQWLAGLEIKLASRKGSEDES